MISIDAKVYSGTIVEFQTLPDSEESKKFEETAEKKNVERVW